MFNKVWRVYVHKSCNDVADVVRVLEGAGDVVMHKNKYANTTHCVIGDGYVGRLQGVVLILESKVSEVFKTAGGTRMLEKIKRDCFNDTDPITMDRFDELGEDELENVVMIGDGKQKHCMLLNSAYELYARAVKNNQRPRNPIDPGKYLTKEEIADIDKKMKRLNPSYVAPKYVPPPANNNAFVVELTGDFYHIEIHDKRTGAVKRRVGFVPAIVEPEHTGNVDHSSAVLITNMEALFEQGKLSNNNMGIDVTRDMGYWFIRGTPYIDIQKFQEFCQRIADAL